MSLLKQIEDKGAVLEWSPLAAYPNLVALGTKDSTGSGFDDHGGELELHCLDFSDFKSSSTTILGKIRANSRFSSIAWSQMVINAQQFPYGLIAGGMVDGNIHVWDPAKLAAGDPDPLLASVEQHQGAINGLHFNPHKESSHLLASGGSDCEVYVTSLEHPDQPSVFIPAPPPNNAKHTGDITKVAWNSQVSHILASSAQNGSCFIWDLRQKRAWCELRDPAGGLVSDVAWNPDQGLHLVTASGDDKNPVLKLWDLRSSTSLPLATLSGHTEGILSVSWCPFDTQLLLSCGKDNRTILWDLFRLQPVYDLPARDSISNIENTDQNAVFGGLATTAGQRRYHVSWSPCLPAVVSACSFDRRVQFFSMTGVKTTMGPTGRAQKWLRNPVGASFGFGGKLVSFDNQSVPSGNKKTSFKIKISQVVEDSDLIAKSDLFHASLVKGEYKQFCESKSISSEISVDERQIWSLMNVICFGTNAREELLTHLGFNSQSITAAAEGYAASKQEVRDDVSPFDGNPVDDVVSKVDAMSLLNSIPSSSGIDAATLIKNAISGAEAEPTIRKAIIVGNFEAAVNCCLEAGLMAEALLLAQCGDQALRVRTQAYFFEKQRHQHPFLNVLHAVIKSELRNYVLNSDLTKWRETLALLSTYGKSEEFPSLCEVLANRLETELQDPSSATLCYMCAANVERTVQFWTDQLKKANEVSGNMDTIALENYVEKVIMFTHANPVDSLGDECAAIFAKYAELLANQGRLEVALGYLKGSSLAENILIDQLYHAGNKPAGSRPPPFPFARVNVEAHDPVRLQQQQQPQQVSNKQTNAVPGKSTGTGKVVNSFDTVKTRSNSSDRNSINQNPALVAAAALAHSSNLQQNEVPVQYILPTGWIQLIDQNSGHPYYVNQATGQSQWEAPPSAAPVSNPTITTMNSVISSEPMKQTQNISQPQQLQNHSNHTNPQSVISPQTTSNSYPVNPINTASQNVKPVVATAAAAETPAVVPTRHIVSDKDSDVVVAIGQMIEGLS
eukprot:gene12063-16144_t